jgi:YidC/Oxa1 family membrane protein insertase
MEPQSNTRNLLLFFLSSALVIGAWTLYLNYTKKPTSENPEPTADLERLNNALAYGTLGAFAPGDPGVSSLALLSQDPPTAKLVLGRELSLKQPVAVIPPEARQAADLLAHLSAGAFTPGDPGLGSLTVLVRHPLMAEALLGPHWIALLESANHQEPVLGDEHWFLRVKLTTRGGAVLSVTLNQFRAANAEGRPVVPAEKLELVPEEKNLLLPSNFLLHYEHPDKVEDGPLPTLGDLEWTIKSQKKGNREAGRNEPDEVVFAADVPGQNVTITKTFTLRPDEYHVGLKVEITSKAGVDKPVRFRYQQTSGHGLPIEGVWYTAIFRNALTGILTSGGFLRDFQDSRRIGHRGGGDQVFKGDATRIEYAAIAVQYFASAVVATERIFTDGSEERTDANFLDWARPTVEGPLHADQPQLDDILMRVNTQVVDVKPDAPVVHKYLLYYGPVKIQLLADEQPDGRAVPQPVVNRYLELRLDTLTDYQSPGWMGSFASTIQWTRVVIFFTNLMHRVLYWLHEVIPSWGICIIVLTVLVRGLMHPVSRKQARTSMRMQALVPELKKLQEKHKNDKQAMAVAQMDLYRKHGVSPIGSCWVVLLQMPIFLGLYYCLQESIHFRLASFLWMDNLAAPDMLIKWGEGIPIISTPPGQGGGFFSFLYLGPYFNLLPVIAVTFMIVQQKFLMPPPTDEQQEMQQKMMKYMMVFFGLMFYKVAAGLCLYFIVSSVWGLAERKLLPKAKPATVANSADAGPGGPGGKTAAARRKAKGPRDGQSNGTLKKVQDMWQELLKQAKKK